MSMHVKFEFTPKATKEMIVNLEATKWLAIRGAYSGIKALKDEVYVKTRAACPRITGSLWNSIYEEMEIQGTRVVAHVGHGGKYNTRNWATDKMTDDYAVERHEFPGTSLEARKYGGTSKWLEKSFNSIKAHGLPTLQIHMAAALQGRTEAQVQDSLRDMYYQIWKRRTSRREARRARKAR